MKLVFNNVIAKCDNFIALNDFLFSIDQKSQLQIISTKPNKQDTKLHLRARAEENKCYPK